MSKSYYFIFFILCSVLYISCNSDAKENTSDHTIFNKEETVSKLKDITDFNVDTKTIHILVSLCDNKYQGIVPVPAKIGNGQDPDNNLYWGAGYGIKTYFKRSKEWNFVKSIKIDSIKMERIIFQHTSKKDYFLIADAYNGKNIKECTKDFFYSCAGSLKDTLHVKGSSVGLYGNAKLISYIGHNGLMEFQLSESFTNMDNQIRDCIILACYSKKYFTPYLEATKANPLVWTTHLMAPEAYTLHDALTGYINKESNEKIRTRTILAYSKYQKCSEKAARNLLVSGW